MSRLWSKQHKEASQAWLCSSHTHTHTHADLCLCHTDTCMLIADPGHRHIYHTPTHPLAQVFEVVVRIERCARCAQSLLRHTKTHRRTHKYTQIHAQTNAYRHTHTWAHKHIHIHTHKCPFTLTGTPSHQPTQLMQTNVWLCSCVHACVRVFVCVCVGRLCVCIFPLRWGGFQPAEVNCL